MILNLDHMFHNLLIFYLFYDCSRKAYNMFLQLSETKKKCANW